jgi:hypothetical protein
MGAPGWQDIEETFDSATRTATCIVKRAGRTPVTETFSWLDAEKAGLTKKDGPWQTNPKRMLKMRARGFALRDMFADRLQGIVSAEEAEDYVPTKHMGELQTSEPTFPVPGEPLQQDVAGLCAQMAQSQSKDELLRIAERAKNWGDDDKALVREAYVHHRDRFNVPKSTRLAQQLGAVGVYDAAVEQSDESAATASSLPLSS